MSIKGYEKVAQQDDAADISSSHPMSSANFFSILTFWWINRVLKLGTKRPLVFSDFFPLCEKDKTCPLTDSLQTQWLRDLKHCETQRKSPALWLSLLRTISLKEICTVWVILSVETLCRVSQPWFVGLLISTLLDQKIDRPLALACSLSLGMLSLICVCAHLANFNCEQMGMRLSSALRGVIFHKILRLSKQSLQQITQGRVIDLISNDIQRVELVPRWVFGSFSLAVELPAVVLSMVYLIGWKSLVGVAFLLIVIPLTVELSLCSARVREQTTVLSDQRISLMNELLSGIRAIKAHAWEDGYREKIKEVRRGEILTIAKKSVYLSVIDCLPFTAQSVATFLSAFALVLTHETLTPAKTFMLLCFINIMRKTLILRLGNTFQTVFELFVSLKRLESFLLVQSLPCARVNLSGKPAADDLPRSSSEDDPLTPERKFESPSTSDDACRELEPNETATIDTEMNKKPTRKALAGLSVSRLTCKLQENYQQIILDDINVEASEGSLTVITGPVGSGKSTFLSSILGEFPQSEGTITFPGTFAYASQAAWIFSGTIRENILFGEPYDTVKYNKIVDACALREDLGRFPYGDLTFVGERGVVLSGGQRARVSLARAVYADADGYLLDDPLSSVDVKVGEHIFEECICKLLRTKTRLFVTYDEKHMQVADQIVVFYRGYVLGKGTFSELRNETLDKVLTTATSYEDGRGSVVHRKKDGAFSKVPPSHGTADGPELVDQLEVSEEERAIGKISLKLYSDYFRAGAHPVLLIAFVVFYLVAQVVAVSSDVWLFYLTEMSWKDQRDVTNLSIFAGLVTSSFLFAFTRTVLFFFLCLKSSERLHDRMVIALLQAPVLFFDSNPTGRILNRFSKDVGCADEILPKKYSLSIQCLLVMISGILVPSLTNFWVLVVSVPITLAFAYLAWYFIKTSRELKRLESVYRSPVFSHFSETMNGLDTIRTRSMEKEFIHRLYRLQDEHNQSLFMVISSSRWFAVRGEILFAIFVALVAIVSVLLSEKAGLLGLSLAYTIETGLFSHYAFRYLSDVESNMTSVERIMTYASLDSEPGYKVDTTPPEEWPRDGNLSLRNVLLTYYHGGPQVLKDVSFDVQAKTKMGIVGRTGDGKSSIVAALLRMPEPKGEILIDGVSVKEVDLKRWRRCFTVLSQTPFLFSGTLRKNLDPLEKYQDDQLWSVLETVQLMQLVERLEGQLGYELAERGENLSVGQRQLVCLARTLLQKNSIIILDEPTADVDPRTERQIWSIVDKELKDATVIIIAHRLSTIKNCDMVLVVREGQVGEISTPENLLGRDGGMFNFGLSYIEQ